MKAHSPTQLNRTAIALRRCVVCFTFSYMNVCVSCLGSPNAASLPREIMIGNKKYVRTTRLNILLNRLGSLGNTLQSVIPAEMIGNNNLTPDKRPKRDEGGKEDEEDSDEDEDEEESDEDNDDDEKPKRRGHDKDNDDQKPQKRGRDEDDEEEDDEDDEEDEDNSDKQ